jgi:hypothetical protein
VTTATDGQKDTSTPKPRVQKKPAITLKEVGRYTTDTDSEEEKDSARAQRFTAQGSDKRKTDPENALAECQCTTQTAPRGAALEMNSHTHHPTIGPCNTLSSNNRRAGFPRCPFNHFETRVFFCAVRFNPPGRAQNTYRVDSTRLELDMQRKGETLMIAVQRQDVTAKPSLPFLSSYRAPFPTRRLDPAPRSSDQRS